MVIDHWRYFAGVIRAEEGSVAEISNSEYSYHIPEPLGVVGQIIPWNFPLLMATWKLAPAGASFHVAINNGKFHGMICPTTPNGSGMW